MVWKGNHTSKEMLGQLEASSEEREVQAWEISRRVSSVTQEQNEVSRDNNLGHATAAALIAASDNLWQEDRSSSLSCGLCSVTWVMLDLFIDSLSSCGHLSRKSSLLAVIFSIYLHTFVDNNWNWDVSQKGWFRLISINIIKQQI